jgi:hypothetical protein
MIPIDGVSPRRVGLGRRRRGLPSAPTRAVIDVLRDVVAQQAGLKRGIHPVTT